MLSARPKIAELVFQVYGRSIHPELFEVQQQKTIERDLYTADIKITGSGHLVTWQSDKLILSEVATSAHHPLPSKRRLMSHTLRGRRQDYVNCYGGMRYETDFSLEVVDRAIIRELQQELVLAGTKDGMLFQFSSGGRLGMNAFSYIHFESRLRSLKVRAIHTFPDDSALVKSETVFRLPEKKTLPGSE